MVAQIKPQRRLQPDALRAAICDGLAAFAAAHPSTSAIVAAHGPRLGADIVETLDRSEAPGSRPLAPDVPFRIASITKIYTAAAVFRLWEDGALELETPIDALISDDDAQRLAEGGYAPSAMRVKHLLAHTSGLYDHCHDPVFQSMVADAPQKRWMRREQIALAAREGAPYGPPGAQQRYSDTGYVVLGEIIERCVEGGLDDALRELLKLDRLGLRATRIEADANAAELFHGDLWGRSGGDYHGSFDLYGGGGLVAPAAEVARFLRALLTGAVFDRPETLSAALAIPDPPRDAENGRIRSYLLACSTFAGRDCWGHTGFWGGEALYCPALDLALCVSVFDGGEPGREARMALRRMLEDRLDALTD